MIHTRVIASSEAGEGTWVETTFKEVQVGQEFRHYIFQDCYTTYKKLSDGSANAIVISEKTRKSGDQTHFSEDTVVQVFRLVRAA